MAALPRSRSHPLLQEDQKKRTTCHSRFLCGAAYNFYAMEISFLWSTASFMVGHFCSVHQERPENKAFNIDYNVKDHGQRLTSTLKKK